ncbi:MAG: Hsp20/alpha crystallin family protein [Opitutales bacterium]|nr:Hsp20/alpha crystallin family protein [Opitutales bacterium]MCH8540777.1 Hsp20/alpha crystallin family protein [Opitutales bacterium]
MSKETQVATKPESTPQKVERTKNRTVFAPAVDIVERDDALLLEADVPGATEANTEITLENGVLTIRAETAKDVHAEGTAWMREYVAGDFERSFTITDEIDQEKIEARVRNGVLSVLLPKSAPARPQKIKVQAG